MRLLRVVTTVLITVAVSGLDAPRPDPAQLTGAQGEAAAVHAQTTASSAQLLVLPSAPEAVPQRVRAQVGSSRQVRPAVVRIAPDERKLLANAARARDLRVTRLDFVRSLAAASSDPAELHSTAPPPATI